MSWLRKRLGLCVHVWSKWTPFYALDKIESGQERVCFSCNRMQRYWHPDGH